MPDRPLPGTAARSPALPLNPLSAAGGGAPAGVSTPVYEKIWSQFKGTHDQRCTERCDVHRGARTDPNPQPEPPRGRKRRNRTRNERLRGASARGPSSIVPRRCRVRTRQIQNKSCCVCRLQSGARCGPPPVGRPPSALQQRAASMLRWHFTLQRGRIAGYSLR